MENLLRVIRENVDILDSKLKETPVDELLEDRFNLLAVLHALQVSSQALIDLAAHLITEAGISNLSSYSEIPETLARAGIIAKEDSNLLRRIIGFINVVVHQYTSINLEIVERILKVERG